MKPARPSWKSFGTCWLALVIALAVASPTYARLVQLPGFDELFAKSDLVVIARPTTKTADTSEKTVFPGLFVTGQNGKSSQVQAIGVETTFTVEKVIAGRLEGREFVLHHLRRADPDPWTINGPLLVSFDPSSNTGRGILLFLVREKDGRYAPYSGQTDPGFSVFALQPAPADHSRAGAS